MGSRLGLATMLGTHEPRSADFSPLQLPSPVQHPNRYFAKHGIALKRDESRAPSPKRSTGSPDARSRAYCDHEPRRDEPSASSVEPLRESASREAVRGLAELGPPETRLREAVVWIRRTGLLLFAGLNLLSGPGLAGPFAPAAGEPGSTAVPADAPTIIAWAAGWLQYQAGPGCDPGWQTPEKAVGTATGDSFDIVCLGEGGRITLTFDPPVSDGPGADFAVFENAINDTFLELAFVEVSSDGDHFVRFPNHSLTTDPVGPYGALDPTAISGFAGKYRQGFGTPFDLADLRDAGPELDVGAVRFVRLIDVSGNGEALDSEGRTIYDPFPATGSAGFDLDAIAVLREPGAESPIESWRNHHFGEDAGKSFASDSGDPDEDGRANLLEYCLGSHPLEVDLAPVLTMIRSSDETGDFCEVEFLRRADLPDAELRLQSTPDLSPASWREHDATLSESQVVGSNGLLTVQAHLDHTPLASPSLFVRLGARRR